MSFQTFKKLVSEGVLQVGSIWTGDPRKNEIIKYIGEKHKVGFFESVNKLCIRASLEDEDTFNELYIQRLIVIKNTKSLNHLPLIKQSRLSVMPIDYKSWKIIYKMGKV